MVHASPPPPHSDDRPAVEAAQRKVAAVLDDLELATGGEVRKLRLDDLIDSDAQGRPVVKRAVDIELLHRPRRNWSR